MADNWGSLTFSIISPTLPASHPRLQNIEIIEYGKLQGHLWEQLELPCYRGADLLLCLGNTAPIVPLAMGGRVVTVVHDLAYLCFPDSYSRSFRAVYRTMAPFIMQHSAAVITVSETAKQSILAHYPKVGRHLFVVHNGGLPDDIVPENTSPCAGQYLLYVGSFSKLKNFPAVVEIANRVLSERKQLSFVFIGGQKGIFPSPNFRIDKSVSSRMHFLGQVNDFKVLARYYKHAELLIFPSLSESSGLPPIEAMSLGCPVVVSEIAGLKERCGDAAAYCDPYDIDDIYRKVDEIIQNGERWADLSKRGLEHARKFTWTNCVSNTLNILRPIVQEQHERNKRVLQMPS
jgi:glycosyltransferase involved in cell wall biosynthesis